MKRKAALSIITAAFLIGVAACGNGNINSSGAAASNENMHPQRIIQTVIQTQRRVPKTAQEQKTPRGLHLRILQNISSSFAVARVDGLRILSLIPTVISVVNIMIPIWELPGTAMKTEPCI